MGLVPGRNRRLESAISTVLMVVLVLIGLGVFKKQFDADMSRFGIDTTAAGPSLQQVQATPQELTLDSPAPDGFKKLSETQTYGSENLYEKINGKAPLYVESGFKKLLTKRFVSEDDEGLWMEVFVYDLATARNAFSVYSLQKRADVIMSGVLDARHEYSTDNALYFVSGQYYIELLGSAKSDKLLKGLAELGRGIKGRLAVDQVADIAELSLFPPDSMVAGSAKLYLASAFGFENFTDVFACRYKFDDELITAFLSRRSDPRQAQTTAESYYNFLIENDAEAKVTANKTLRDADAKILDFYGTTEIVFATGPFVGGVHEAEDQQAAEELAARLLEKLSETARAIEQ